MSKDEFKKHVVGVTPLKQSDTVQHVKKPKKPRPKSMDNIGPIDNVGPNERLNFARSSLPTRQSSKLKKGHYSIEDTIDLHGMTSLEAKPYLDQFIQECLHAQHRCVRIVHGKGRQTNDQPVIKNKVNQWLRENPHVLAFCSTQQKNGGTGAVDVLLDIEIQILVLA